MGRKQKYLENLIFKFALIKICTNIPDKETLFNTPQLPK